MNTHALQVVEFPRVLALVAERAPSALGAARVRALEPRADQDWIDGEHARVAAVRSLLRGDSPWRPEGAPDATGALQRLRVTGAALAGPELLAVAALLGASRRTRDALGDARRLVAAAVLARLVARLVAAESEEDAIARAVGDDGAVRDDASPALRRIRRDLRASAGELVKILERVIARLEHHHQVPDASVTLRNGRYVIPVRREARGVVGGIVHDTSDTGQTLFVEPPAAIEFGNRIRELEADEHREVDRILRELSDTLRPLREAMADALDALAELDALYARARYAEEFSCGAARPGAPGEGFAVRDGRHPLLLAQGIPVVPFDLTMEAAERTLLVSGPNTGGKTVLLKALALISAMVQSGVPAPVADGSRVAVFDDFFADIGDEQSIQASLSTFSAHVKNLSEILRLATPRSLVLIDELGSGTDPVEGAALGGAILEELTSRGTTTVATTHLGALKELAGEVPGVVNASLQFDAAELAPTYRLIKGVPGRSYGLGIARRLRLPDSVLARAEARVPQDERRIAALVEELEKRDAALAELEREARTMADQAREKAHALADREQRVRARERDVERRAREEARRYALDARNEIERAISEVKRAGSEAVEEAARAARQKAEQIAAKQAEQLDRLGREEANAERRSARSGAFDGAAANAPVVVGDWVDVATLGGKAGKVVELRAEEAVVAVGAVKLSVPTATLRRSAHRPTPAETAGVTVGDVPDVTAPREIDLRGMRVDEIDALLLQALDSAIRADLRELRIIHGKGTGALRDRVGEMLRKDTRVRAFRLGAWNEGGAGVTVAEL
ncbi:MAG TPA: endonuclease MutS2 [Gemmatimonadaceae bacterium]|nr:endonuclease MutS2 [Gemmatimonadaceae bacterium]